MTETAKRCTAPLPPDLSYQYQQPEFNWNLSIHLMHNLVSPSLSLCHVTARPTDCLQANSWHSTTDWPNEDLFGFWGPHCILPSKANLKVKSMKWSKSSIIVIVPTNLATRPICRWDCWQIPTLSNLSTGQSDHWTSHLRTLRHRACMDCTADPGHSSTKKTQTRRPIEISESHPPVVLSVSLITSLSSLVKAQRFSGCQE